MVYKNDIDKIIGNIKNYNKITDLFILYNIDRKIFVMRDKINDKPIIHFIHFSIEKFNNFMCELNKLSLWNSDYNLEFKIIKY